MKTLKILLSLCIYISAPLSVASLASDDSWLIGTWLHAHEDPNQTTKIVFKEGGKGSIEFTAFSMVMNGAYEITPDAVKLEVEHPSINFDAMSLIPDKSKKQLSLTEKESKTKMYVKQ
jgi:hypothetical protein